MELRKLLGRFLDVCNAIAYAHSRGVLHRDLKPGNIMLGKYGETLVVDWGLAKVVDRPEVKTGVFTRADQAFVREWVGGHADGHGPGNAPVHEPRAGRRTLDLLGPASDVYSLGATLYYLLTGRPPFEGDDVGTVLKQVQQGEFRRPRAVNPEIARPLEAICLKAMALKPGDRYASPKALADDIEHWLADEPVTAYREPLRTRCRAGGARKHKVSGRRGASVCVTAAAITPGDVAVRSTGRPSALGKRIRRPQSKAQRQLALSYIDHGVNELEHGEPRQGLAILGQAYRAANAAKDAGLRRSVCALLGPGNGYARMTSPCRRWPPWPSARTARSSPRPAGPDGPAVGRGDGQTAGPPMKHDTRWGRGLQPGRHEARNGKLGQDGPAVGRGDRPTARRAAEA